MPDQRQRSESEQRAYDEGRALGDLLSGFRAHHPRFAGLSDEEIITGAGDIEPGELRGINSADPIERGSAREELYGRVADQLGEKRGGFGDALDAGQRKSGLW